MESGAWIHSQNVSSLRFFAAGSAPAPAAASALPAAPAEPDPALAGDLTGGFSISVDSLPARPQAGARAGIAFPVPPPPSSFSFDGPSAGSSLSQLPPLHATPSLSVSLCLSLSLLFLSLFLSQFLSRSACVWMYVWNENVSTRLMVLPQRCEQSGEDGYLQSDLVIIFLMTWPMTLRLKVCVRAHMCLSLTSTHKYSEKTQARSHARTHTHIHTHSGSSPRT